jgi:hypothetical protein
VETHVLLDMHLTPLAGFETAEEADQHLACGFAAGWTFADFAIELQEVFGQLEEVLVVVLERVLRDQFEGVDESSIGKFLEDDEESIQLSFGENFAMVSHELAEDFLDFDP